MTIKFPLETEQQMISSIKRFVEENMDGEIGDLDSECYEPEFGYWKR